MERVHTYSYYYPTSNFEMYQMTTYQSYWHLAVFPSARIYRHSYALDQTSWIFGVFLMMNAIVGAGLLTLPYSVLHSGGLAIGLTIEILMGFISWGSLQILGWLMDKRRDDIRSMQVGDLCVIMCLRVCVCLYVYVSVYVSLRVFLFVL